MSLKARVLCSALGILIASGCIIFGMAHQAKAATVQPKPFVVYFQGDPSCVVPGQTERFPLVIKNIGATPLFFDVSPEGVNRPGMTYGYGVSLANGTDHLTPSETGPHWLFGLKSGQSVTKTLVVKVQPQAGVINDDEPYSLFEQVLVSPGPLVTPTFGLDVSATPVYCGQPVRTGGMK